MKTLYESILDTDFDTNVPGENLPGVDKFMSILSLFKPWKKWSSKFNTYATSRTSLLKFIKNILDNLAEKPVKSSPTKKWAIVSYPPNCNQIKIYCVNKDGNFRSYQFIEDGCPGSHTLLSIESTVNKLEYNYRIINRQYCVPSEICDLIDYVINNK